MNIITVSFFKVILSLPFLLQIMTPFLTAKLAGQYVAVDAMGLLLSTLQVSLSSRLLSLKSLVLLVIVIDIVIFEPGCASSSIGRRIPESVLAGPS